SSSCRASSDSSRDAISRSAPWLSDLIWYLMGPLPMQRPCRSRGAPVQRLRSARVKRLLALLYLLEAGNRERQVDRLRGLGQMQLETGVQDVQTVLTARVGGEGGRRHPR